MSEKSSPRKSDGRIRKRAKSRLSDRAEHVKWIFADAASFVPSESYDFGHDRAAFHFLTNEQEIENYINTMQQFVFCRFRKPN